MDAKLEAMQRAALGPVVLRVDRLDALRRPVPAGTRIAPDVEGWPRHRVVHHLLEGYAEPVVQAPAAPAVQAPVPSGETGLEKPKRRR